MRYLRFVLAALAMGAWVAGSMPSAQAQTAPSYQSSEPAKDAMLDHPPSQVRITFDQPLDESSWINVLDECGNEIDGGPATVDLNEMTVDIAKTPSGMYEVVYKAVGLAGATGSSTSKFEFMVHHGEACGGGHGGHHPPGHGGMKKHHHGGGDDDGHGDHDGHPSGGGSGHSGHGMMPGMPGMTHSGHTMAPVGGHGAHGHGAGHGNHHGGGNPPVAAGAANPPVAAGDTIPVSADAEAVLVGLGLALAVGMLGGWLLRMTGNLTGA